MSDWQQQQQDAAEATSGHAHLQTSAGSLLRAAREAQGLHIAALAVSLKVPVKKLEALEAERFDELPDAVFARALAASVCRALKVDPTEILSKLPQTSYHSLTRAPQHINTPFRLPSDGPGPTALAALKKPIGLAVIALLVAALGIMLLPDLSTKARDVAQAVESGLKSSTSLGSSSGGDAAAAGTAMGVGEAVPSTAEGAAKVSATAAVSTPVLLSPTLVISESLAETTAAAAAAGVADGIVVFTAQAESWVEVTDARGKTTLRRKLQAGESAGASGALPLQVTVGRADQTQVLVRGKPYSGAGKVRDNVLRFEVR